jgi:hypothetical protein
LRRTSTQSLAEDTMSQGETPACIYCYCPCYIGRAGIQLYWVVATNTASIITYSLFAEYNPRRNHDRPNGRCGHTAAGDPKEKCRSGHFALALKDTSKDKRSQRRDRLALENKQCMICQAGRLGWLWRSLSRPTANRAEDSERSTQSAHTHTSGNRPGPPASHCEARRAKRALPAPHGLRSAAPPSYYTRAETQCRNTGKDTHTAKLNKKLAVKTKIGFTKNFALVHHPSFARSSYLRKP